jgi:hypothetical protein
MLTQQIKVIQVWHDDFYLLITITPDIAAEITGYTVMNHLDKHNILVDFQHGFRNKRSFESQLVIATEDIARNLDNNQQEFLRQSNFCGILRSTTDRRN